MKPDYIIAEGVTEIHEGAKIFTPNHIEYVVALAGNILLNDTKGRLLNIIESIGLPDKQETAIKRMVTDTLYDTRHNIQECLELVEAEI